MDRYFFVFWGVAWGTGEGRGSVKSKGRRRREGILHSRCKCRDLGLFRKRGKGKRKRKREEMGTSGRGVKDNRKNLLVIKLQTDQIYIILYMYK